MKKIMLMFILLLCLCHLTPAQENIALARPVTASISLGTNSPGNLNDGKLNSRWESTHGADNQWVQIDLGDVYDLTSSKVVWEGAAASQYQVMVSPDSKEWRSIGQNSDKQAPRTDIFNFTEENRKEVRYIRLDLQTRTTIYGFSIYEWEVYGTLSDVIPSTKNIVIKPQQVTLLTGIPDELTILSLNNSLIDNNDQPAIFNELASSAGKNANWTKQTRLGQSLRFHYEEGDGITANGPSAKMQVRAKAWTHIILQEQSSKPLTDPTDFLESVRLWRQYIKQYCPNPNAKIILTQNWPYTDAKDFEKDMAGLYESYKSVAQELGISIAPVGSAYDLIRTTDGINAKNALYTDNRHPSVLASYLSACTIYATLFNTSPVGISYKPAGLSPEDAVRIQTHAWNALQLHPDIVNDTEGTIYYTCKVLDQFNRPMEYAEALNWSVDGGGSINNGIFTSNGQEGRFTVTAENNTLRATAYIQVVKAGQAVADTYFAGLNENSVYNQNFDNIGREAVASLPIGWKIEKRTDAPRIVGSFQAATTQTEQSGGNNISSTAKNGLYNFGAGDAASATDRAIGGISTGIAGGTRCINMYLKIKNTGDREIDSFSIEYDIEKYRAGNNSAGFIVQMYYSPDGITWTSAGENFHTFFKADNATNGYPSVPDGTQSINGGLMRKLSAGDNLYLAWNYSVAMGTDAQGAQALALDNVSVTANKIISKNHEISQKTVSQNADNNMLHISGDDVQYTTVFSMTGTLIYTFYGAGTFDISNLNPGIYIVKTTDLKNIHHIQKITI